MKKLNQFVLLFVLVTAALFNSCTTDVEPIDPAVIITNPVTNGQLKVDIDGQTFVATNVQAVVNSTAIAISGLRSGNNDFIQITLPSPLNQVGTYTWANATAANTINAVREIQGDLSGVPLCVNTRLSCASRIGTDAVTC